MQNPFALAAPWPDVPRRYIVHLRKPYFTAFCAGTGPTAWILVNWAGGTRPNRDCDELFRATAEFYRTALGRCADGFGFVERSRGHAMPRYLMARSANNELFIVEPEHSSPLVEVREGTDKRQGSGSRFDTVTAWRLAEMRKYYCRFLEREAAASIPSASLTKMPE